MRKERNRHRPQTVASMSEVSVLLLCNERSASRVNFLVLCKHFGELFDPFGARLSLLGGLNPE
jgi:hypothetical protein